MARVKNPNRALSRDNRTHFLYPLFTSSPPGIPSFLRCEVWMSVSGAKDLHSADPDKYLTLTETVTTAEGLSHYKLAPPKPNGTEDTMVDIIKRDLHRTFPENPRYVKCHNVHPSGLITSSSQKFWPIPPGINWAMIILVGFDSFISLILNH